MSVRVRFAPSPTGYLHVGGARTALFNWLFARANGGSFVLRIEDTDQSRYVADAENDIYESLRWLGLEWDEGPDKGGNSGPYRQSERKAMYAEMAERLVESGAAYPCFCTAERLQKMREEQEKGGGKGYDRHCRDLAVEEVAKQKESGVPFALRLKVPVGIPVVFEDKIRGRIETPAEALDDAVLMKSDGFPTYHLANIVDDHAMGITHVLRGDEWISSTPRHILLYQAFGWEPPVFAHLPVILSPQGGKLSKRKGAVSVRDFRNSGYLSETLFNFLSLLGWAPGNDEELMSSTRIVEAFSLDRVTPKAAVFDTAKMDWMNGQYLRNRTVDSLLGEVTESWQEKGWMDANVQANSDYGQRVVALLKDRSKTLRELDEGAAHFFKDPEEYEAKAARKHFKPGAEALLEALADKLEVLDDFGCEKLECTYKQHAEETGLSGGKLIHPTRLSVSGVSFGPGLFELLEVLGKDRVLSRMRRAASFIRAQAAETNPAEG